MERSSSQKTLFVLSIINIVMGALSILAGIMSFVGARILGSATEQEIVEAGVTAESVSYVATAFGVLSVLVLIIGGLSVLEGVLGIRAANDRQKIMPVWVFSIIGLVFSCANTVLSIVQGGFSASTVISLALNAAMFWISNNIKKEAGR